MTMQTFNLSNVDSSWQDCIKKALSKMDQSYLQQLHSEPNWLPGHNSIFNAFSLPVNKVRYVLFGESPYPRQASANGYAFWDADVGNLWSDNGLDKKVNRATSLRNLVKMLLVAEGLLDAKQTGQPYIAAIDKQQLIQTNSQLFHNLIANGFLLLNATPVLNNKSPQKDANHWKPFTTHILAHLIQHQPKTTLVLFGKIAAQVENMVGPEDVQKITSEHPYNVSFIQNTDIQDFFRQFHLLVSNCLN